VFNKSLKLVENRRLLNSDGNKYEEMNINVDIKDYSEEDYNYT